VQRDRRAEAGARVGGPGKGCRAPEQHGQLNAESQPPGDHNWSGARATRIARHVERAPYRHHQQRQDDGRDPLGPYRRHGPPEVGHRSNGGELEQEPESEVDVVRTYGKLQKKLIQLVPSRSNEPRLQHAQRGLSGGRGPTTSEARRRRTHSPGARHVCSDLDLSNQQLRPPLTNGGRAETGYGMDRGE
jgi:hypothetical protein